MEIGVPTDEERERPSFGAAARVGLKVRASGTSNTSREIAKDELRQVELKVRGWRRGAKGLVLEARRADHSDEGLPGGGEIDAVQREEGEGAWPFAQRVARAAGVELVSDHDNADFVLDHLEEACPLGFCVLIRPGVPAPVRFARAMDFVFHRAGVGVLGTVRTLAGHEYRLVGACEAGVVELTTAEDWTFGGWPEAVKATKRGAEVIGDLLAGERCYGAIPLCPGVVSIDRHRMFATEVATEVRLDDGEVSTRMELVDLSIESVVRARQWEGATTLLGVYSDEQPGDPHLVCIGPATDDASRGDTSAYGFEMTDEAHGELADKPSTSRYLAPLRSWRLLGERSKVLYALQAAPGFVEADASAFYAEWRAGDQILFDVDASGVVMVRGAPRRTLGEHDIARVGVFSGTKSRVALAAAQVQVRGDTKQSRR